MLLTKKFLCDREERSVVVFSLFKSRTRLIRGEIVHNDRFRSVFHHPAKDAAEKATHLIQWHSGLACPVVF